MANISSWLNEVANRVPGAIKDDIDSSLRSVIRDFCTKTLLYIRELTPIDMVSGTSEYLLIPPTNTAIVGIETCDISGIPVSLISEDLLNRTSEAWSVQDAAQPSNAMVNVEKILKLKETPNESVTAGITVSASLKPSPTTDTIPDFIYDDWYDCILYGVLARLLKTPSKTYTNINLGAYYEKEYKGEWTKAKGKKITGIAKMSLRVQNAPFSVV
jgi:hypothetical protein